MFKPIIFIIAFLSVIISVIIKSPPLFRKTCDFYFNYGFDLKENFYKIPEKPCILVSNYCAKNGQGLGYLGQFNLPIKYCLVVSDIAQILLKRVFEEDKLIFVPHGSKNNYNIILEKVKEKIEQGYYIFCYIEPSSYEKRAYKINKIRSGMFSIAKQLDIPIVPLVMDNVTYSEGILFSPSYRIHVGDTIIVKDVEESRKKVLRWMTKKLNIMGIDRL